MRNLFARVILIISIACAADGAFSQKRASPVKLDAASQTNRKTSGWDGEWTYPSRYYGINLEIKRATVKKFEFKLTAVNGANTGEIDGTARVAGTKAYFDDRKSPPIDSEASGCKLTFVKRGKSIDIDATDECGSYGGVGVGFSGKLSKGNPPLIEQNFVERDVFPNLALDRRFKALVVGDYETFLDAFHQIYEETDLDGFGAMAFSACVRGICPYSAGIIMYDKSGRIWAAVVHNVDDAGATNVNYYTNDAAWTAKLPKTIDAWANGKKDSDGKLTIIYKSKK